MTLKLHLLSGNGVETKDKSEYETYQTKFKKEEFNLSDEQEKAFKNIIKNDSFFRVHLLQGTTGSGKTIVYFKAIEKIISRGLQTLILLPEIGLTGEFEKKLIVPIVLFLDRKILTNFSVNGKFPLNLKVFTLCISSQK